MWGAGPPSCPRLAPLGEDGHGPPSAEELLWNLGDLEDHLIQPTRITGGKTEKQRSSYQRISGGSGTRTQAPCPRSSSLPPSSYYSKRGCDPENSVPAVSALTQFPWDQVAPVGQQAGPGPQVTWVPTCPGTGGLGCGLISFVSPPPPEVLSPLGGSPRLCVRVHTSSHVWAWAEEGGRGVQCQCHLSFLSRLFSASLPRPATGKGVPGLQPQGGGWLGRRWGLLLAGASADSCAVSVPLA